MGYEIFTDPESLIQAFRREVLPAFESLIGRIRDERTSLDAVDFDSGFSFPTNPIFRLLFPPVIMQSVRMFAEQPVEQKVRLRQEVFDPYAMKFTEVCTALRKRYPPALNAIVDFSAKASEVMTMIVCAAEVEPGRTEERFVCYSDKYSAMQTAFMRIGERVGNCEGEANARTSSQSAAPAHRRERYCLPTEALGRLFNVRRETISRWKTEDSAWARRFREMRDQLSGMERLAREYNASRNANRFVRVSFDEQLHNPAGRRTERR